MFRVASVELKERWSLGPCGHEYCEICINQLRRSGNVKCPMWRFNRQIGIRHATRLCLLALCRRQVSIPSKALVKHGKIAFEFPGVPL